MDKATHDLAGELMSELRRRGIDPMKIGRMEIFQAMLAQLGRGESTLAAFFNGCNNLLILNPNLAYVPPSRTKILQCELISTN